MEGLIHGKSFGIILNFEAATSMDTNLENLDLGSAQATNPWMWGG